MKITKSQLRRIIKEELSALLEATDPHDQPAGGDKPTTTELDKKKKEWKHHEEKSADHQHCLDKL